MAQMMENRMGKKVENEVKTKVIWCCENWGPWLFWWVPIRRTAVPKDDP